MNDCYIGKSTGDNCHLTNLQIDLQNIQDLNDDEKNFDILEI